MKRHLTRSLILWDRSKTCIQVHTASHSTCVTIPKRCYVLVCSDETSFHIGLYLFYLFAFPPAFFLTLTPICKLISVCDTCPFNEFLNEFIVRWEDYERDALCFSCAWYSQICFVTQPNIFKCIPLNLIEQYCDTPGCGCWLRNLCVSSLHLVPLV